MARAGDLPVGVKQKIEILKALARGAEILILDEPTSVLTPQETDRLFQELKTLCELGHTIVFISHKIHEVKTISDRVTIMRGGRCVGVFDTDAISEQEIANNIVGRDLGAVDRKPLCTQTPKTATEKSAVKIKVRDLMLAGRGDVPILGGVSFDVRGGEILGVVGVQGNGQAELAETLTRYRRPDAGSIFINGSDASDISIKQLRDLGCGYIPEDRLDQGVAEQSEIRDNLISNLYSKPPYCKRGVLRKKKVNEFANSLIADYDIDCNSIASSVSMLSGGNMQKLVAARECSASTDVLIAEQPTRGVDIGAAEIIHKRILSLRSNGCAVLLISADLSEVMRLSDCIIVLFEGKITAYFDDVPAVTEEELGLCMLGIEKHSHEQIGRAYCDK